MPTKVIISAIIDRYEPSKPKPPPLIKFPSIISNSIIE